MDQSCWMRGNFVQNLWIAAKFSDHFLEELFSYMKKTKLSSHKQHFVWNYHIHIRNTKCFQYRSSYLLGHWRPCNILRTTSYPHFPETEDWKIETSGMIGWKLISKQARQCNSAHTNWCLQISNVSSRNLACYIPFVEKERAKLRRYWQNNHDDGLWNLI